MSATQDVLALLGATAFVLFFAAPAFLSSRKRAGEKSSVEIALRKASSSCFSITTAAGGTLLLQFTLQSTDGIEAASQSRALLKQASTTTDI
jgi:hypothetical protein